MRLLSSGRRGLACVPSVAHNVRRAQLYGAAQVSGTLGTESQVPDSRFYAEVDEAPASSALQRLSPAARLGSSRVQGTAAVGMHEPLQDALAHQVLRANKAQLRHDAAHLASLTYAVQAETRGLAQPPSDAFMDSLRGTRASALYAAAQMPGRYAVLARILDEVQRRIPSTSAQGWAPAKLVDWNAQAFDALWASLAVFGSLNEYHAEAWSKELLSMGTHLLEQLRKDDAALRAPLRQLYAQLRLRGDKPHMLGRAPPTPTQGSTLGVYAYGLSGLPNDAARERQVQRMWKSDADVLVLVESATPRGFACIAAARAQLLSMQTAERPCHVVAPCSHDRACPILRMDTLDAPPTRAVPSLCSYSQMYHAPAFTRATLEDARSDRVEEYCYVVVQRGARPSLAHAEEAWRAEVPPAAQPHVAAAVEKLARASRQGILDSLRADAPRELQDADAPDTDEALASCLAALEAHGVDARRVMQLEAYSWPRIVRTPLKKGGHVTFDACCPNGALERFTLAKSAGRQAYQDARKSRQGELFPHADKTGRPTIQREGADLNALPERLPVMRSSQRPAPGEACEHLYIAPDAMLYARTAGTARVPKRTARRAPKWHAKPVSERGTRLSRKPNRARLDEELHLWDA